MLTGQESHGQTNLGTPESWGPLLKWHNAAWHIKGVEWSAVKKACCIFVYLSTVFGPKKPFFG